MVAPVLIHPEIIGRIAHSGVNIEVHGYLEGSDRMSEVSQRFAEISDCNAPYIQIGERAGDMVVLNPEDFANPDMGTPPKVFVLDPVYPSVDLRLQARGAADKVFFDPLLLENAKQRHYVEGQINALWQVTLGVEGEVTSDQLEAFFTGCYELKNQLAEEFQNSTPTVADIVSMIDHRYKNDNEALLLFVGNLVGGILNGKKALQSVVLKDDVKFHVLELATNLLKYGEEERAMNLRVEDEEFVVETLDNGIGVDEEDFPNIWKSEFRGSRARVKTPNGSGTGVARLVEYAESVGGTVEMQTSEASDYRVTEDTLEHFNTELWQWESVEDEDISSVQLPDKLIRTPDGRIIKVSYQTEEEELYEYDEAGGWKVLDNNQEVDFTRNASTITNQKRYRTRWIVRLPLDQISPPAGGNSELAHAQPQPEP